MKFDVIGHVDSSLPPVNVAFTSSTLLDRADENLIGTVTEEGQLNQVGLIWKDKSISTHCTISLFKLHVFIFKQIISIGAI